VFHTGGCAALPSTTHAPREKNLEKAQKEAKVKARRDAARATMLADTLTDSDLAAVEDAFLKATGAPAGLELLAKRRAMVAAEEASSSELAGGLSGSGAAAAGGQQGQSSSGAAADGSS
jgi:hypothetical protein